MHQPGARGFPWSLHLSSTYNAERFHDVPIFPPKKKKHTFLTSHRWRFPPYRGHMKKLPSLLTQQVQGCAVPKKNKCGCEKPPFTLLYSGDIGCICAIGIFDEHWMYWMDLANSEVHSSVVSYWAWWSWEVSSYPFQKTQKKNTTILNYSSQSSQSSHLQL